MKLPSHTCHQWGKVSQTQRRQSFNPIRAFWSYSEHPVLSTLGEICITFLTFRNTVISSNICTKKMSIKTSNPRGIFLTLVPHNANYQISNIPKIFLQLVLILRVSPTISMSSPPTTELGTNKSVTLANSTTYIFVLRQGTKLY